MAAAANRETLETDLLIVGAGPAGLAAAIRLRQRHPDLSVTVIDKAAEIGGHVISGAVMDLAGLDALLPDWRLDGAPVGPDVTHETLHLLTEKRDFIFPHLLLPPQMRPRRDVIVSLGDLCRWLGEKAAELGADIFPMTAAVDILTNEDGAVIGVVTGDLGRDRAGKEKPGFAAGIALKARYTFIAEGARGSLAKKLSSRFGLGAGRSPQKYGLGFKEVWEIPADRHEEGRVDHFLGFPLGTNAGGGGFAYHAGDNRLYLGLIVHLDYENPTLSPFGEFQRFKAHPTLAALLEGGTPISYGARAVTTGGRQSVPELAFPGGVLIGCAAGFMNAARIKAIHNAMLSGMGAADAAGEAIAAGRAHDRLEQAERRVMDTGIAAELGAVRNVKPLLSRFGVAGGVLLSGVELWSRAIFGVSPFGTLEHRRTDSAALRPIAEMPQLRYERPPDAQLADRAASVHLSNITHDEDQPVHLRLIDPDVPIERNLPIYGEPAPLYCPAGVYEVAREEGRPVFRIHAANCIHCKACDIKDPAQNIVWTPPEGGSGPSYSGM